MKVYLFFFHNSIQNGGNYVSLCHFDNFKYTKNERFFRRDHLLKLALHFNGKPHISISGRMSVHSQAKAFIITLAVYYFE